MPRGGRRSGSAGKTYSNRTDLNTSRGPLPVRAATGQQYGKATEQMAAQRALPMGPPPGPAVAPPMAAGAGGATPPAPAGPLPGELGPLDAPTSRPGEPVTAGVPVGPGPGTEVLGLPDENGAADLAMYLPLLEMMASRPGASMQTRNFVRRLRGAAPVV